MKTSINFPCGLNFLCYIYCLLQGLWYKGLTEFELTFFFYKIYVYYVELLFHSFSKISPDKINKIQNNKIKVKG